MTYTEWYQATYNDQWTDNHAPLMSLVEGYEDYCKNHDVTPVWDG